MAKKTSSKVKKQVIRKIVEQVERELEACWDTAEGNRREGGGEDIDAFVGAVHRLCGSFGRSALKGYLEERDEQQFAKKKRAMKGGR